MLELQNYLLIGILTRTHGAQGTIMLRLQSMEADELPEMEWVFVEIDGLPVPFLVNEVRSLQTDKVILSLDTVFTEPRARELVGCRVFVPAKGRHGKSEKNTGLSEIKGYTVIDQQYGEIGKIIEIVAITGNPLLRIRSDQKEILIPAHRDIILKISKKNKTVLIKAPDGLTEL
jgi:16S rRNA processing protein RimM